MLAAWRTGGLGANPTRAALLILTLVEVGHWGYRLNPAIPRAIDRPLTPLIVELQRRVGRDGRIIGLGAELPPNVLMRYGLADARNYDSVETRRNLDWLRPLYDPQVLAQTSRREITWDRVEQARDRLQVAGVRAVVGATPPPASFTRTQRFGGVWVAWLDADPLVDLVGSGQILRQTGDDGRFVVELVAEGAVHLRVRETFDPGWRAEIDGEPVAVEPDRRTFLQVPVASGRHLVTWRYDPIEVRVGGAISIFAALALVFGLTGSLRFRSSGSVVPRLGRTQAFGLESDS